MGLIKKLIPLFVASAFLSSCSDEQTRNETPNLSIEKADKLLLSLNGQPFEEFECISREKYTFTFANKKKHIFRTDAPNTISIKGSKKSLGVEQYESGFYDGELFYQLFRPRNIEENEQSQVELTIDIDSFYKDKNGNLYLVFDQKFMVLFADVSTQ